MFRTMAWKLTALTLLVVCAPAWTAAASAPYLQIDHKARFDYDAHEVIVQTHHPHARPVMANLYNAVRVQSPRR